MEKKDNLIVILSLQFALDIIVFTEILQQAKKFNLANQLLEAELR